MSPSLKGEGTHTSAYQCASSEVLLEPDAPLLNSTVSHFDRLEVLTPRRRIACIVLTSHPSAGVHHPGGRMASMENQDLFICIDHVGLAVPDLDEAIKFHSEVFGWRELHREVNEEQGVAEAMIGTGTQGEENAKIQLLAPLNEKSTIAKWLDRNGGPGIQQLAYRVHDLDHVSAVLRERGLRLLFPEAKRGTADSRINFVHPKDAGGVLLELVEPAKDASH